jgi:TldD protein
MRDFAQLALDTATRLGAEFADARIIRYTRQDIAAEDHRVQNIHDSHNAGIGVRVLCKGAWGFAASGRLAREDVERVATDAVSVARASGRAMRRPAGLVPEEAREFVFRSPREIDPFAVSVQDKVGLLLEVNAALLRHGMVKKAFSGMTLRREEKLYVNSEGSVMENDVILTGAHYTATAIGHGEVKSRSYNPPPRTLGYENIQRDDLLANAERVAQQATAHLTAKECPVGKRDLILDSHNLALTIHESVGHATELDRALGMEESLAGRSFAVPSLLNSLEYGSPIVNFVADNTLEGGLATEGFDDDGVPGQRWHIVQDGVFVGYSTSREVAGEIGLDRSVGGCRADHWGSIPIVRIPNLGLAPGTTPLSLDDLIADTDEGIYIEGMGSFSIDQMRCNFQFGGDAFWEIKNGRIVGMLKNVTYQSMTTEFWNSCDAICDERFWVPNGVLNCGKGDPMQVQKMTHGAAPARFRQVNVGGAR